MVSRSFEWGTPYPFSSGALLINGLFNNTKGGILGFVIRNIRCWLGFIIGALWKSVHKHNMLAQRYIYQQMFGIDLAENKKNRFW